MTAGRLTFRGALWIAVLGCSAICFSTCSSARTASAATTNYFWNLSGGTWFDTVGATPDWNSPLTGTLPLVDWLDGSGNTAIFSGATAGTVTLGATVDPGTIDFNATGYTIAAPTANPSNYQIDLVGSAPTINVGTGAASVVATINANIAAAAALTISDTGSGNTTLNLGGSASITGGTLNIVGNTNKNDTFTIAAPNLSLSTLKFSDTVASTTTLMGVNANSTITFTGSTPTIDSGESGNSSYKDISYISETVIGSSGPSASTTPLIIMNLDGNGTQSAVSFGNGTIVGATSQNSFPGGIYLESAAGGTTATTNGSGSVFNSTAAKATGTTRLNFNLPGANGSNVAGGAGTIYVYANGAIITDQGSQQAFTENMTNNIVLNPNGWTPTTGLFVTAIGGTKALSGNTTFNYSGVISGAGSIIIGNDVGLGSGGAGVTEFSNNMTYTGETIVNSSSTGDFKMGVVNALPINSGTGIGTTLVFGNQTVATPENNSIGALDLNGFGQTVGSLTSNVSDSSVINGITNTGNTIATLTINGPTFGTGQYTGGIGISSTPLLPGLGISNNNEALTRTGTGTTILGAYQNATACTYVGDTTVTGTSTLAAGSLTGFSPNSNFIVEATLDLAGWNNTINSLASVGAAGIVTTSVANPVTSSALAILTIGSNSSLNANVAPVTTFNGQLRDGSGTQLGLTVAGAGTQILTGANAYSGPTTVQSGVLTIASPGSLSSATTITVGGLGGGGTLNGNGAVNGPINVNAGGTLAGTLNAPNTVSIGQLGTIAPGTTGVAGTLTTGALTFFGGSNYNWKATTVGGMPGSGYDTIAASGISFDSSVTTTTPINVNASILDGSFNPAASNQWQIASSSSAITLPSGAFNAFTTANIIGYFSVVTNATAQNSNFSANSLVLEYTPESFQTLTWQGGAGTWQPAGTGTSWNNGVSNGAWANLTAIAEFASGSSGGVVGLGANVAAPLLQFDTTGYTITGGSSNFTLSDAPGPGFNSLRVQVTNASDTATISAGIVSPLTKYGAGTLLLNGGSANTFGGSGGGLTVYAGTLRAGSNSIVNANITNYGTVAFDQSGVVNDTYSGTITGAGSVHIMNSTPGTPQTLTFSSTDNAYTGGTTIGGGTTLNISDPKNINGATASVTLDGGTLQANANSGPTFGGVLNVTANGGAIADTGTSGASGTIIFAGGAVLAPGATFTKNGPGTLLIGSNVSGVNGNGWTGSGTIVVNDPGGGTSTLQVGNIRDENSNPSSFLGNNNIVMNNGTTLLIAAGTAAAASITPPQMALNGSVTISLYNTGGSNGADPLEPALNSATTITAPSGGSTITVTGSGVSGNALSGSSTITFGNTVFAPTSGTITIQTVAGVIGSNSFQTGATFGAVTDNGDTLQFLGQGSSGSSPQVTGSGVQFNGTPSGTTPTLTGAWIIGDPTDLNAQVVAVAVQRVTNSNLALTTGNITVNPGSQLSITPAEATVATGNAYGPASGTQTITLYGAGPTASGSPNGGGALTVAAKSQAEFNSNVNFVLGSSVTVGGLPVSTGSVEIDLSNGSSTQQTILTIDGSITGSAGLNLNGGDLTQLVLNGANNMTGHTHDKGGEIIVNANSSLGTGDLQMNQSTNNNPIVILNNPAQSVSYLMSTYGTQTSPGVAVTQTIQLNGAALTINEPAFSSAALTAGTNTYDYGISPADGTIITGSTSTLIGTGSIVYAGAANSYLSLSSANTYSGGTSVTGGMLATTLGGTLGTGPLSLGAANTVTTAVSLGASQSVTSLSNSTAGSGSSTLAVASGSTLAVSGSLTNTGTLRIGTATAPISGSTAVGGGTVVVSGSPNLAASSQIQVTTGTLQFNAPTGTSPAVIAGSGANAPSITVSSGATLQLAGAVSALSDPVSGNLANVNNNSSATGPGVGGLQVTGTNQSVGIVSGMVSQSGPTTYTGDTVVGPGATFTATQILQNTLTIGAGATVTLAPSAPLGGGGVVAQDDSASTAVASPRVSNSNVAANSLADPSDPIVAIQSAIASGAISSAAGAQLENRLAAIEHLATVDPGLNASLLESRILAAIPSSSIWSSPTTSTIGESGIGLLAVDSSTFAAPGSTLGSASASFSMSGGLGSGAAAVPEPSSLLLIGLGSLGLAALGLKRRRRNRSFQGC